MHHATAMNELLVPPRMDHVPIRSIISQSESEAVISMQEELARISGFTSIHISPKPYWVLS